MKPEAPQMILVHGALGGAEQFSTLAERLSERFEVHRLDLPGHGAAPLGEAPFALASFAASVRSYLHKRGLRRPWLFGHSMGGLVGLLLALEPAPLLGGVITLGTKLEWTPEVAAREIAMLDPEKIEAKVPAFAQTLAQRHSALGWKNLLARTADMLAELGERPPLTAERLAAASVPVFIGLAERDNLVSQAEAQRFAQSLSQGGFWTVAGAHPLESVETDALAERILALASGAQA